MNRRQILASAAVALCAAALAPAASLAAAVRTRWRLGGSEGFDALCFLGPLSGKPFYARFYEQELAAFKPRLSQPATDALMSLHAEADKAGALLGPGLCTILSGGPTASLDDLIASTRAAETVLLPPYKGGAYWDEADWTRFTAGRERLLTVFEALKAADFAGFRHGLVDAALAWRAPALQARLAGADVAAEPERLLGRRIDPQVEVVLLWFSKPHGVRVQGGRFLCHVDYPDDAIIRIAGHEGMHPPFDMKGPAAQAAYLVLEKDALLTRIIAEHDHAFGYNTLEGLLNEDTVQALDQIVGEHLGVAKPPAERWARSDDGMHVLAAGLYGLLKADGYDRTGGNIADWIRAAAKGGRLGPASLHAAAARVLGLPADQLWPRPRPA